MGLPFNVVTRQQTPANPSSDVMYETEVYYPYPAYIYNPMPVIKWFCSTLFWIIVAVFILNLLAWGIIFIISFYRPKVFNCPKCKKIFKYKKHRPQNCPLCGVDIDEFLKPR